MRPFYLLLIFAWTVLAFFTASAKSLEEVPLTIQDARTGEPLSGVSLRIGEEDRLLFSNELGKVYLPSKNQDLRIQLFYLGYKEKNVSLNPAATPILKIELEPKAIELEEVTILADSRSNLQKINALDLQLRPINSSQDVLRQIPGLFIAQHAGGGKAEQIFLRGFDLDHGTDIGITVDGMPVNMVSHAHGQGYADLHFLIPETIQTLDFDKGSYESDKGNFATAGYVDFQTKNRLPQNELKLDLGQFNTLRGLAMLSLLPQNENHHAYIAAEHLRSDGYFEASQNLVRTNIFAKYTGTLSPNTLLKFSASTFQSSWDASGQIPERAVRQGLISRFGAIDSTEGGNTGRNNLNLEVFQTLSPNSLLQSQFYFSQYDFSLFSNFTFFLEDSINGDQIQQRENRRIYGNQTSYKRRFEKGKIGGEFVAGFSFRLDQVKDMGLFQTRNRTDILERLVEGDVDELNAAVFLEQKLKFGEKLDLQAGLRYDYFRFAYLDKLDESKGLQTNQKGILSPKLKVSYTVNPKARLYLNLGTGFHSNDSRLVLEQQAESILPRSYGADVGIFLKPWNKLLIQFAGWWMDLEQEFVYVGDAGIVEASGRSRRLGLDISLRQQLMPWLFLDIDANYTHARSRDEAEGESFIPLAPIFTSTGGLTFDLKNGFSASLRYRWLGDRPANEDYSLTAKGYQLLDGSFQYESTHFRIRLSAENLLNAAWEEAQFETESRLVRETMPVSEIHFTPGSPFFAKLSLSYLW